MAYEVIILGHLHMPLYFLGTFTEYPYLHKHKIKHDKTTKQTSRFYLYDSDTIVIHIRTYLYMFARLYQYKYKSIL